MTHHARAIHAAVRTLAARVEGCCAVGPAWDNARRPATHSFRQIRRLRPLRSYSAGGCSRRPPHIHRAPVTGQAQPGGPGPVSLDRGLCQASRPCGPWAFWILNQIRRAWDFKFLGAVRATPFENRIRPLFQLSPVGLVQPCPYDI